MAVRLGVLLATGIFRLAVGLHNRTLCAPFMVVGGTSVAGGAHQNHAAPMGCLDHGVFVGFASGPWVCQCW